MANGNGSFVEVTLKDVLYTPSLQANLILGIMLDEHRMKTVIADKKIKIYTPENELILMGERSKTYFTFQAKETKETCNAVTTTGNELDVQAESRDEAIGVDFELKEPDVQMLEKPNVPGITKDKVKPVIQTKVTSADFTRIVKARNLSERKEVFFYPVNEPKVKILSLPLLRNQSVSDDDEVQPEKTDEPVTIKPELNKKEPDITKEL
ncbi:hypothetical protein CHUAL_004403 [Chamberlinius hualienensis]